MPIPEETLAQLIQRLKIPDNWDVLICSDGSGNLWGHPIGWAAVVIEKRSLQRLVFWGMANNGTNNVAELMGVIMPLTWFASELIRRDAPKGRAWNIHIITDSEYVAGSGGGDAVTAPRNLALRGALALFERQGLVLNWHPIARESVELNRLVDRLSREARVLGTPLPVLANVAAAGITPETANPD